MKSYVITATAGIASGTSAQTIDIDIFFDGTTGTIIGEFVDAPADLLAAVWDFAGRLRSADGTIDLQLNSGFTNPVLSPNPVSNNSTSNVSFLGVNATQLLASPEFDGSNPIVLGTFTTTGSFDRISLDIDVISYGVPGAGFPNVFNYTNVNVGHNIPTPATAGLLGLGGLVAARRRR